MQIDIVNLKKSFGETKAVDDVCFSFTGGQIVGFVGPNGAGKTTTMRILATLDEPTDGDAYIDGVSVVQEPEKARKLVGYMPDNLPTHRDINVHDYLDFFARSYGLKGSKRKSIVESVEEFTSLTGIREKMLKALSKGMKQRVSLARALVHDPAILILDEPAAGLDPRARIELRELVKVLSGRGKAILISSHILSELAEMCTNAVIIERGRILRAGSMEGILLPHDEGTAPVRTVLIRVLARQEELHKQLLELPGIESAAQVDGQVAAQVNGDDQACVALLATLMARGYPIVEFRQRREQLEDLFMKITKGEVQ